jgi:hypothetical protein
MSRPKRVIRESAGKPSVGKDVILAAVKTVVGSGKSKVVVFARKTSK